MRRKLATVLAWVVTAGMLAFLFWRTPFSQVVDATRAAAPWTVPVGLIWIAAIYVADSFAIWKTFGWFLARLSFVQILVVRGATYLLAAINYSVGQGAIVYFVHRATGVPVLRGVATVLLIMGINVLALLMLASVGLAVAPDVPRALGAIVGGAFAGLLVYAAAVAFKPAWLARRPIFDVLLSAGLAGHLRALAVRVPHIATLIGLQMSMLHAFGVKVPLVDAILTLPMVLFVAVLPISVQGIGTTQAAMVLFFARFAPGDRQAQEAAVLAASLVCQALALFFQIGIGLLCLRSSVGRDLRQATASAKAASAPPDGGSFDRPSQGR